MPDQQHTPKRALRDIAQAPGRYAQRTARRVQTRFRERPLSTGGLLAATLILVLGFFFVTVAAYQAPAVKNLEADRFSRASVAYAEDGEEITRFYRENRTWVSLDAMAPVLTSSLLATEDRRFYDHAGIDVRRTLGALWQTARGDEQGGSTLTMQLARNAYPELQDRFVFTRKIQEWTTARRIEQVYEKDEIMEIYLNLIPFAYNAYGVEGASKTYFQRSAAEIDTLQAATLVAMLRGPTYYNPVRNPEAAKERRNLVLRQLVETGDMSQARYEELQDEETELDFQPIEMQHDFAPHFAEHVRDQAGDWADEHGYDLYADGLQIHTTLDADLQREAQAIVQEHLAALQTVVDVSWSAASTPHFSSNASTYQQYQDPERAFSYFWQAHPQVLDALIRQSRTYRERVDEDEAADPEAVLQSLKQNEAFVDSLKNHAERLQAGFVALHPQTGHVKAWVGGRNFEEDRYDHVAQAQRQPGSTFKPFVYLAALSRGYRPNDLMRDTEVQYVDERTGRRWEPGNFGTITDDLMPLREALAQSKNTIAAQLTIDVGPQRVARQARRLGIESELNPVPSLGLGTSEVTLLEMATAYATIANNGRHQEPIAITRIEDAAGRVVATFDSRSEEVAPAPTTYDLLDMMRAVIDEGTGRGVRSYVSGDLAGKTGTTQDNADGWFLLMHPELVMGTWVGFNAPAVTFRTRHWGQGSRNALPIVGQVASRAELSPEASFREPPGWSPPSDFSIPDTLVYTDVEDRLEEYFEEDDERLEREDFFSDGDVPEALDDPFADTDEPEVDPELEDVEEQNTADSLTQAQRVDLPDIGGNDNRTDPDTSDAS